MATVADNIREARRAAGLSQERFAELVGTSRRHVMRWERGQYRPSRHYIARIADVTGQPPESFFSLDDENEAMQALELRLEKLLAARGLEA